MLALFIPLLTPIITELIKLAIKYLIPDTIIKESAPIFSPLIAAVAGAVIVSLAPLAGVDPGASPLQGAELGLAGTGVHQMARMAKQTVTSTSTYSN